MIISQEVQNMCPVAQGVHHGAAPIPEEAAIAKMKDIFKEAYQKQKAEQTAQKETEVSGSTAPDQTDSTSESDGSSTHRNEMESEGTTE